jgi:hypothetical protein
VKFVAAVILLVTGVTVSSARANDARIEQAFYTQAKSTEVVKL